MLARSCVCENAMPLLDFLLALQLSGGHGAGGQGFYAKWLDYDIVEKDGMGAVQPRLATLQMSALWCGSGGLSLGGSVSCGGSRRSAVVGLCEEACP